MTAASSPGGAAARRRNPDPGGGRTEADAAELVRLVRELAELRDENAKLQATIQQLGEVVEERTRRAQQLIGERAQLEARLAERDQQVQQLSWQLGAASVRRRGERDGPPALLARARAWLEAPRRVPPAGPASPANAAPAPAASEAAPAALRPLVPFVRDGPPRPLVGVATFGLAGADLERVLDVAERYCGERGLRPLVLTDCDALEIFRRRRLVFEHLPSSPAGGATPAGLDFELYLQRRLALIRRKWQPVRVIAFGRAAADVLQLWATSPFEEADIADLLGRRAEPAS